MMKSLELSVIAVLACFLLIEASELILDDMESIKISLLPESESPVVVADEDKSILRYGFHRTHDCQNFEKAFICIRKCLDLNFQIAHADKNCVCTCYKNSVIEKYKGLIHSNKWKLGAPTTHLPPWVGGGEEKKPHDYEINANVTAFNENFDEGNTGSPEHSGDHVLKYSDETVTENSGETVTEHSDETVIDDGTDTAVTIDSSETATTPS